MILDTNVLVAALRSRNGASNAVLAALGRSAFEACASTALVLEYEDVLQRRGMVPDYTQEEISVILDSLCSVMREAFIYFRWRPFLPDPNDDLVFECALATGAEIIISHNTKDFPDLGSFGISVMTPGEFLHILPL